MLVATLALFLAGPQLQGEAAIQALREAAVPIASVDPTRDDRDLLFLKDALGKATLFGLGEATHGSREIFQMKHRLFRFLVERMGVTVLLMESSMPATIAMDEYVTQGKGDPVSAARNQGFWTWSTEEVRDLLKWMRAYNLDPKHKKLRVVGIDMQNNWDIETYLVQAFKDAGLREYPKLNDSSWKYGWQEKHEQKEPVEVAYDSSALLEEIRKAMDQAIPVLRAKFGKERAAMAEHMVEVYRQHTDVIRLEYLREDLDGARATITPAAAIAAVEQAKKLLKRQDLAPNVRWGLEIAAGEGKSTGEQVTPKRLRAAAMEIKDTFPKETVLASVLHYAALAIEISRLPLIPRDPFMADNVVWTVTKYLPGQKAAIWAHNSHIGISRLSGSALMMGAHLDRRLGAKYYPLGFAFREGGFRATDGARVQEFTVGPAKQGSLDDLLALVHQPAFFLDMDHAKLGLKTWLEEPRPWRNVGSTYRIESPDSYYETLSVGKLFRGLIYLEKLTPARPLANLN